MFKIKNIYEPPEEGDGFRILVDKSWPSDLSGEDTKVDLWLKEIAPSKDMDEWPEEVLDIFERFKENYRNELRKKKTIIALIKKMEKENGTVTLLYSGNDPKCNAAAVLGDELRGYRVIKRTVGRIHGG